jgi:hypothetical protein
MSFERQIDAFRLKLDARTKRVFTDSCEQVERSLVEGSEITGAPGQPVDTGFLRAEAFKSDFTSKTTWEVTTNAVYAPSIEDGISYAHGGVPLTLRSAVGGFHSAKLTRNGWQRIVDHVAQENAR